MTYEAFTVINDNLTQINKVVWWLNWWHKRMMMPASEAAAKSGANIFLISTVRFSFQNQL